VFFLVPRAKCCWCIGPPGRGPLGGCGGRPVPKIRPRMPFGRQTREKKIRGPASEAEENSRWGASTPAAESKILVVPLDRGARARFRAAVHTSTPPIHKPIACWFADMFLVFQFPYPAGRRFFSENSLPAANKNRPPGAPPAPPPITRSGRSTPPPRHRALPRHPNLGSPEFSRAAKRGGPPSAFRGPAEARAHESRWLREVVSCVLKGLWDTELVREDPPGKNPPPCPLATGLARPGQHYVLAGDAGLFPPPLNSLSQKQPIRPPPRAWPAEIDRRWRIPVHPEVGRSSLVRAPRRALTVPLLPPILRRKRWGPNQKASSPSGINGAVGCCWKAFHPILPLLPPHHRKIIRCMFPGPA